MFCTQPACPKTFGKYVMLFCSQAGLSKNFGLICNVILQSVLPVGKLQVNIRPVCPKTSCKYVTLFFRPSGFSSAINTIAGNSSIQVSEEEKKKILEDENKRLQQLKVCVNIFFKVLGPVVQS